MSNLRQKLLGAATAKRSRIVSLDVGDEQLRVKVRELSFARANAINQECMTTTTDRHGKQQVRINLNKLRLSQVIDCALDPESDQPIFQPADVRALAEQPSNGWFAELVRVVGKVNGNEEADVDREAFVATLYELAEAYERLGDVPSAEEARGRAGQIEAQMQADGVSPEDREGNSSAS